MEATKREQELELEVWRTRMREIQVSAQLVQAQTQLLNINARECQAKIAELEAALKPPLKAVEG